MVKMIHFQAKHGTEALPKLMGAPISIAIKDPKRGTTMAILALAEGAQNDQNERGGRWFFAVGPKRWWKTVFAPQRSFSFQVSTHF